MKQQPYLAVVAVLALSSCGGSTPAPEPPKNDAEDQSQQQAKPDLQIKSELGTIDEAQTDKLLTSLNPQFDACQKGRLGDVPVISGKVSFFVRVGEDGTPKWAYFTESELGDRDTEQCILKAIMGAQFPKPDGGEAEVTHYTSLLLPPDTRAPVAWNPDKVSSAATAAAGCKDGSVTAHVTAYVKADDTHPKKGNVVAVGVAMPQKDADGAIDCIVKAVMEAKIPSPGGYYAKVSFSL